MAGEIGFAPLAPHVTLQLLALGVEQVDQQQTVDDITEVTNPPPGNGDPTPTSLVMVSGNAQTGTVDQQVAGPLVVRVDDQFSNAMSGVDVSFSVTQGGGSVGATSVSAPLSCRTMSFSAESITINGTRLSVWPVSTVPSGYSHFSTVP